MYSLISRWSTVVSPAGRRHLAGYLLLVVVPLGLGALLLANVGTAGGSADAAASPGVDVTYRLILASVVIVLLAQLCGSVASRAGQPRVVGQMLAGVVLGPPVLGELAPAARTWLFPPEVLGSLGVLAQLGVVFFMFQVGLELPIGMLRRNRRSALTLGHAGIGLPFLAGGILGLTLLADARPAGSGWLSFVLFCGLAMSITAVPVLAMILGERGLLKTETGVLATAAAGIGDVTAWCVLALVLALSHRQNGGTAVLGTVAYSAAFAAVMLLVVRPLLARVQATADTRPKAGSQVAVGLIALLLFSAWFTTVIGVHAVFGALLTGVVMPRRSRLVTEFADRLGGVTHWLLLPLFFASVGLSLAPTGLWSAASWWVTVAIIVVASAAKMASSVAAARFIGLGWREASGLGVMMNCRGLTEIIVLQTGLAAGLIGHDLFTMLVLMALVTTVAVGPLLKLLGVGRAGAEQDQDNPQRTISSEARPTVDAGVDGAVGDREGEGDAGD